MFCNGILNSNANEFNFYNFSNFKNNFLKFKEPQ